MRDESKEILDMIDTLIDRLTKADPNNGFVITGSAPVFRTLVRRNLAILENELAELKCEKGR